MGPDVSQFGGLQGYLVVIAVVLTPLILPFATAAAKRLLGPKTEEVATAAAEEAQRKSSALVVSLTASVAESYDREARLRAENTALRNDIDALRKAADSGPPHPTA